MDGALGENGAFELVEVAGDFGVLAGLDEAVFEDVAELKVFAFNEGEEFGGAGVNVRSVDSTGGEEADSGADAEAGEDGKALDVLVGVLVRSSYC